MKKVLAIAVFMLPLAACDKGNDHTVDWYRQHSPQREARAAECRNNARLLLNVDCRNALEAAAQCLVKGCGPGANADDFSIDITPKQRETAEQKKTKP